MVYEVLAPLPGTEPKQSGSESAGFLTTGLPENSLCLLLSRIFVFTLLKINSVSDVLTYKLWSF